MKRKWKSAVAVLAAVAAIGSLTGVTTYAADSISILAQPSVAVVDKVVDKRGTRDVAEEYLNYLYSDEAQRIAGDNYYRPSNQDILKEYSDVFDLDINLVTIDDFGGWKKAQETHFSDGGIFDQIYEG